MKVTEIFGLKVRLCRERKGISQESLAEASDLDRSFISMIERGVRQPTLSTIWSLARALDVKPHELLLQVEKELNESS